MSIRKICFALLLTPLSALAMESKYNMPRGVSSISHDIFDLHMTIFWVCVAVAFIVFSVLIYSLIKFRRSKGAVAANFHENTWIEIIWAVIPLIILVLMAVPATKVLIRMEDDSDAQVNVKITGYQWKWHYSYLDEGVSFFSNLSTPKEQIQNKAPKGKWYLLEVDHPLVLPIHKKIRFLVTSNDVLHSWWVPELGIKRDAVPGFIHESWVKIDKPGVYRGQCAELCGMRHGYMPIVVIAKTERDYAQWLAHMKAGHTPTASGNFSKKLKAVDTSPKALMRLGKSVYRTNCSVCHQSNGQGVPPTFPALKGGKVTTGPIPAHIKQVLNGVSGTAMQAFGAQLSDLDIAAVITYQRNSWGNDNTTHYGKNAGGIVTPKMVEEQRKQS